MFPILPGMEFTWIDPEGTPMRRWKAVMPKEVWQQVVNIRLYGGNPPPDAIPLFSRRKRTKSETPVDQKEINKKRRARRLAQAKAATPTT